MTPEKVGSYGPPPSPTSHLIESLNTHRVNTLTELVRIERIASATDAVEAARFGPPMTAAWTFYVTSHQLTTELRTLTRSFPLSADLVCEAYTRVRGDPSSDRSWNMAWLVLMKIKNDQLIPLYAFIEANKPQMWGAKVPSAKDVSQLKACFEREWQAAVDWMLRHWTSPPSWC